MNYRGAIRRGVGQITATFTHPSERWSVVGGAAHPLGRVGKQRACLAARVLSHHFSRSSTGTRKPVILVWGRRL